MPRSHQLPNKKIESRHYKIEYDAVGRVWKRTDISSNDSYFYHTGGKLIQELDDELGVTVDYLAGQRRYMPGESEGDQYRYFARDHQGSVLMMTDHEQNVEEYKYDAWGEHIDSAALPSTANNIRYAGLRLECFVDSGNSADAIYETGSRHYWPRIGRFLQRDPLTYNSLPNPSKPLSLNPYIYCENNPVMAVDASGLKSTFVRGATMGNASMWLGTFRPGYLYDCCEEHFTTVPEDKRWNAYLIWHQTLGYIRLKDAAKFFHWKKFCDFDPSVAQPDKGCANTTWINPDLACTFLAECKHGSCAKPGGDIINGGGGGNGGFGGGGGGDCPGKQRPPYKGGGGEEGGEGNTEGNDASNQFYIDLTEEVLVGSIVCGRISQIFAGILSVKAGRTAKREISSNTGCIDDPCDAFRHCYWICEMAKSPFIGVECAEYQMFIHEMAFLDPNSDARQMDIHNDYIGLGIGASGADCESQCKNKIITLELMWLKEGKGYLSSLPDSNPERPNETNQS